MGLTLRLLGPVEAWDGDRKIELGPRKQRLVLAVLALEAGRPVELARLVDLAWPDDPPRTATHAIRVCVSALRAALRGVTGAGIRLHGSGYALAADPMSIDVHRFRALLARARAAGDDEARATLLAEALALWSGPALSGVATPQAQQRLCAGLEETRLGAVEDRLDAQLRLGRHHELLDELPGLVAAYPLRERLAGQLMLARYRDGRAAEALAGYRRYREQLADELGLDAGPALQQLELAILRNDPGALTPQPARQAGARPAGAPAGGSGPGDTGPGGTGPGGGAAGPVPAQLPPAAAGFAGRAEALAGLDRQLAARPPAGPIVVIAGTAGVGKTALAVHWAHQHRETFGDGQLYVNLAGYAPGSPMPPERALAGFLRALGVSAERIPLEADEASALYRSLLADRRVLVVLDNARGPDQVRPLLPGGPGCMTVITSRDRLDGLTVREGAQSLILPVLRTDEALALLAGLLGAPRTGADPVAVAEVAALCARLPLALRIAAAHLTRHPDQPVASLVAELREGNRLAVLSVAGDEQSAVRAAFDLSYATLSPGSRQLFQLVGLHPGADLSVHAAAALAGLDVAQARAVLADLTSAHLVDEPAAGRFAVHDLLRLYAGERAAREASAADREAAAARLCEFYLRAADAAARVLHPHMQRLPLPAKYGAPAAGAGAPATVLGLATHAGALAWLEAERPNLVAIVTWAGEHGPREPAWLIADAMRGYFWMRRYATDWLAVAEAGLAAAAAGPQPEHQAMAAAHLSLAQAQRWLTRYPAAASHLIQARDLAGAAGWPQGAAAALGSLANVYRDQGRLTEAAEHHRQARDIYRQTGGRGGEATSLGNLGNVLLELGRPAEAVDCLARALALYREIGARHAEGNMLNSIGCAFVVSGRLEEARRHLEQALDLHRETGSREGEADDLNNLAELHLDAGQPQLARQRAAASLALARESGDRRIEVDASNTLGTLARHLGDPATGLRHHTEALQSASEAGYRQGEAAALTGLALTHSDLGRPGEARAAAERALLITRQTGLRMLEGRALTALAAIALEAGQPAEARDYARAAVAVHRETGHLLGQARARRILDILDQVPEVRTAGDRGPAPGDPDCLPLC
ncbi:MAG TPA: BTAD domain-containing putative transcriptional regulator [Streptosporangiaceae bacterium]|nr:BTAD domain-containing putative transcriptional regulator [Streptosporangiaceae bacterium]